MVRAIAEQTLRESMGFPVPPLPASGNGSLWNVPGDEECFAAWEQYEMLENVREHSLLVAQVCTYLARRAHDKGLDVHVPTVRAAGLLHDIAKTYCILHGGNHSQLGGAWAMNICGNPVVASGVTHHVFWPFELDPQRYFPQLAVIYADKRARHNMLVSIEDRFTDLYERYGATEYIRSRIRVTHDQALDLERILSQALEVDLNENTFDSGRLV